MSPRKQILYGLDQKAGSSFPIAALQLHKKYLVLAELGPFSILSSDNMPLMHEHKRFLAGNWEV